jgi:type 1 glutamine amidotransferase
MLLNSLVLMPSKLLMKTLARFASLGIILGLLVCACADAAADADRRVLVFTKNQTGKGLYVHDNIPASVEALKKLGVENHFAVEATDDPSAFTDANLKRFQTLIFDNTNNELFDGEEQKAALQRYIRAGGGFVGIHSASGSMRQWPWFWSLLGGKFNRHAKMQKFTVKVKDPKDAAVAHLPASFEWTDEFYFLDHLEPRLHVLLVGDLAALDDPGKDKFPGPQPGGEYPLAWRHGFEGGRAWYVALGHQAEHYSDPEFTKLLLGGILWTMGGAK